MARAPLQDRRAVQRLRSDPLQHDGAETLARAFVPPTPLLRHRLVPGETDFPLSRNTIGDLPGDLQPPGIARQRAIFGRVGAELMKCHAEILHGVRLQGHKRSGERYLLLAAEWP